jgi:hemolysin III
VDTVAPTVTDVSATNSDGAYTVGAVIHVTRRPDPWPEVFGYHEVFHVFVLVAVLLHLAAVAFVVLPKG